jgi:hypothetical protein
MSLCSECHLGEVRYSIAYKGTVREVCSYCVSDWVGDSKVVITPLSDGPSSRT